jgi:hypothetical protein
VLVRADLPPDWRQYAAVAGENVSVRKGGRLDCSLPTGGPTGQPAGYPWVAAYGGGIYQKAKLAAFVTSYALVFKDGAAAKAQVGRLRSAAYVACWSKTKAVDAAKKRGAVPGSTWRAGPAVPVGPGGGALQGHLRFIYQARVGGKIVDANGAEDLFVYRKGRLVILFPLETALGGEPTKTQRKAEGDFTKAVDRLLGRLPS